MPVLIHFQYDLAGDAALFNEAVCLGNIFSLAISYSPARFQLAAHPVPVFRAYEYARHVNA
ncbi:MAG: hypothetical protein ABIR84_07290 [Candidatus Nitrotoga sp.]